MKQYQYNLRCIAVLVAITTFSSFGGFVAAQQSTVKGRAGNRPLDSKVSQFDLNNETLLEGLWKLARGPVPFGFGFEKVLKPKISDPDLSDSHFDLRLENKSIREILDAICKADPRYTWSSDAAFVNVFPQAVINDSTYLLNRRLPTFELRNATDEDDGLLAIVRQLPPQVEQVAHAQVGGADPYPPEPWTVTLQNVTVRQVVNRLAAHGGPYGIWIFGGSKDFRSFGFFNTHPSPWLSKTAQSRPKNLPRMIRDEACPGTVHAYARRYRAVPYCRTGSIPGVPTLCPLSEHG